MTKNTKKTTAAIATKAASVVVEFTAQPIKTETGHYGCYGDDVVRGVQQPMTKEGDYAFSREDAAKLKRKKQKQTFEPKKQAVLAALQVVSELGIDEGYLTKGATKDGIKPGSLLDILRKAAIENATGEKNLNVIVSELQRDGLVDRGPREGHRGQYAKVTSDGANVELPATVVDAIRKAVKSR